MIFVPKFENFTSTVKDIWVKVWKIAHDTVAAIILNTFKSARHEEDAFLIGLSEFLQLLDGHL